MPAAQNGHSMLCPYKESPKTKRDFSPSFGWVRNDGRGPGKARRYRMGPAMLRPHKESPKTKRDFSPSFGWVRNDGRGPGKARRYKIEEFGGDGHDVTSCPSPPNSSILYRRAFPGPRPSFRTQPKLGEKSLFVFGDSLWGRSIAGPIL